MKITRISIKFVCSVFLFFTLVQYTLAQDILNYTSSVEYCGYLINKNDFQKADNELNRIERAFGQNDTLNYLKIINLSNQPNNKSLFHHIRNRLLKTGASEYLYLSAIKICFNRDSILLVKQLTDSSTLSDETKTIIKAYVNLYHFDTNETLNLLSKAQPFYGSCEPTKSIIIKINDLKKKHPLNAVALSFFIPGLGKIYANQPKNGILTLFTNGLFAYQAYRGFNQKGLTSIYGWVFLTASTVFYFGNLYGSYTAINRYNEQNINVIRDEIKASFNCIVN
jgi:TM2 domain-containing membrane protein YozV